MKWTEAAGSDGYSSEIGEEIVERREASENDEG